MDANLVKQSIGGDTANALALQGDVVIFPKLSSTQRSALPLTFREAGSFVYDTTSNSLYFWDGSSWQSNSASIPAGGLTGQSLVKLSNTDYHVGWAFTGGGLTRQEAIVISLIFG
jgi:hypothetical protein